MGESPSPIPQEKRVNMDCPHEIIIAHGYSKAMGDSMSCLVETGESRTPRPKDPLAEYTTSLSGGLFFASESFHRPNIPEVSRELFGGPYRRNGYRIPDLWRLHPLFRE